MELIPSWGPDIDARVQMYIDGIGQWVRGNDDWSCEGKRYHGDSGLAVRDTRLVTLRPVKENYLKADSASVPEADSEVKSGVQLSRSQPEAPHSECADIQSSESHFDRIRREIGSWWTLLVKGGFFREIMTRLPAWRL